MKKNFTTALVAIFTFVSGLAQAQSQYVVNGNATEVSTMLKPNSFQLTPDAKNQNGNVWNKTKIDIKNNSFVLTFKANFGDKDAAGAEGIALVFQNDTKGAATLGSGNQSQYLGFQGIKPAFNVEFDTYYNGSSSGDIAADHISISKNGASNSGHQLASAVQALPANANIEDGNDHSVEVDWDANANTLYVFFDGSLRQTYTGDVITDIFSGDGNVYWGFTASTGNSTNLQSVYQLSMTLTPIATTTGKAPSALPVSLVNFAASQTEKGNILTWATATEKNSDYFQIERSSNATIWTVLGKVASHNNSTTLQNYSFTDKAATGTVYYRLKMVDFDASTEYSKVVTVKNSSLQTTGMGVYPNPVQNAETLTIKFSATENANATVSVIYMQGNVVKIATQTAQIGENTFLIETAALKPGLYIVQATVGTNKETTRVIVK
jgi:hypothetical protein